MKKILYASLLFFSTVLLAEGLQPTYTVMIPMRDGTELPTDLYLPRGVNGGAPCILMRCPGGRKAMPWRDYSKLTEDGFLVAMQDTRSALDPEGKTIPYWADGWGNEQDGYDTVEWLAKSHYSNGKVGTIGFSAVGITQQMMAPSAPPSLKCQYIGIAAGSIYHHATFKGGQLLKSQIEGWLGYYARDPSIYSYICNQPHYNEFWKNFDTVSVADKVQAPAIHYGGWYDVFLQGTLDSFVARQERGGEGARGRQKLLIGPWTHYWPKTQTLGDFQVPDNAKHFPRDYLPQRWFDHYLKGIDNGAEALPPITYYVMGPFDGEPSSGNVWRTADRWPLPAEKAALYLGPDNGLIFGAAPPATEAQYSFIYDPKNPVPTIGGCNLFLESGPMDQRPIEERSDVLVFTSAPLVEEIEITGHLLASIYFSSDKEDVDLALRLCDLYPDGRSILITDSICRVGGPHVGQKHHAGTPLPVPLDLSSTAIVIAKGHRLRLSIAGSNFPRFEHHGEKRSFGGYVRPAVQANNSVHVGERHPSHLILPIVRRGDRWYGR